MAKLTTLFYIKKLKADVVLDVESFTSTKLRTKLKYKGPFDWDKFTKHLLKPSTQKIITKHIDDKIPKKALDAFKMG
jgi:hypothetical protein